MSTDIRELLARARKKFEDCGMAVDEPAPYEPRTLMNEIDVALAAEPEVVGPSDEEWDALVERIWDKYETVGHQGERFMYGSDFGNALDLVRKELARWGSPATPPAPEVGEAGELVDWVGSPLS